MKNYLKLFLASGAITVFILDSAAASAGAVNGLELCLHTVIPSLFPFLFLSMVITGWLGRKGFPALNFLCRTFRLPEGAGGLLLLGWLGGYPTGAHSVSLAYEQGRISKHDAQRMLVVCSNCGPAYIFGVLSGVFSGISNLWAIWGICMLSSLITSLILPGGGGRMTPLTNIQPESPVKLMDKAIRAMARICGWVIMFRVILSFAERWFLWLLPPEGRVLLCGLTELANGCLLLHQVSTHEIRFILACAILSFGGLSVMLQTYSVISYKLDTKMYFPGKVLHSAISTCLACIAVSSGFEWKIPLFASMILCAVTLILWKSAKKGRFSEKIGV